MAGLLVAEKIACAADVEVMACQLEAGAEIVERLHDFEPPQRGRRQLFALGQGQIAISAQFAAADAATQLIELRQPKHVSAVDDQGVGGRDVETAFDDVGRQQQVKGALVERGHHIFEVGRRHAAMRHRDTDFRHDLTQFLAHLVEIGDVGRDVRRSGRRDRAL